MQAPLIYAKYFSTHKSTSRESVQASLKEGLFNLCLVLFTELAVNRHCKQNPISGDLRIIQT